MTHPFGKGKLQDEHLELIKQNCTLTCAQLRKLLKKRTGMDVSEDGIAYHLRRIREEAERATRASSAAIDKKVEEFVDINTRDYLGFLDSNIRRLNAMLRGEDPYFKLVTKEGLPSTHYYISTSKMLGEQIERAFKIRPDVATLNLNIDKSDDIEEKLAKYEALYGEKKED